MERAFSDVRKFSADLNAPDRHIDQAVCELYGLTEEEIKVVEGK